MMGSNEDMATQFSKLTQMELDRFCSEFGIRADHRPELPKSSTHVSSYPHGKIPIYTRYFDQCNLRSPFTKFFLLVYWSITTFILANWPVRVAQILHFGVECRPLGYEPTLLM